MASHLDDSGRLVDSIENIFTLLKETYKAQGMKNERALETINLKIDSLPSGTEQRLDSLARCCQVLDLEQINSTNLLLKYTEVTREKMNVQKVIRKLKGNELQIKTMLEDFQNLNSVLDREITVAAKICNENHDLNTAISGKIQVLQQKIEEYTKILEKLNETGPSLPPEVTMVSVVDENVKLKDLDQEIESLKTKLNKYRKLPPDIGLAKEKIRLAKMDLGRSQEELDKAIEAAVQNL